MTTVVVEPDIPLLRATGLSKTYGQTTVLQGVDFEVRPGQVHALLGGNGSGKSTMIKGLAGVISLDGDGDIVSRAGEHSASSWNPQHARAAHLRFVHQDLGLFPEMTVVENLAIGFGFVHNRWGRIRWRASRARARGILNRFGIAATPDTRVGALSLAQAAMLAIGRALQNVRDGESAVVFLDEPTGALPAAEAEALHQALRGLVELGHAVVLVTHDIDEALARCDEVTVLRDGARIHSGPTVELDRGRIIELIVGRRQLQVAERQSRGQANAPEPAIELRSITGAGLDIGDVTIRRGEIVGVTGLLNCGAETLLQAIFGLHADVRADVLVGARPLDSSSPRKAMASGVAYLPCDRIRDGAFRGLSVSNNLAAASMRESAKHGRIQHRRERREALALTHAFRVRPDDPRRNIESLSGGNQQKVLLARWVRRNPRVLLLDDPTRGVDVGARADIWELLREEATNRGLAVLFTSSDPEELATFCDRVLILGRGRLRSTLELEGLSASAITAAAYAAGERKEL